MQSNKFFLYKSNKSKYYKLKIKFINGGALIKNSSSIINENVCYSNNEIDYIEKNIKYLVHWTTIDAFNKIMLDKTIKSSSLLQDYKNLNKNFIYYDYLVFISIITTKYPDNLTLFSGFFTEQENIAILIDKNILFDKNVYYYFSPYGDRGDYWHNTIPNCNIKNILNYQNKIEYIKKLDVDQNLKKALLIFIGKDINWNNKIFLAETRFLTLDKMNIGSYLI